MSENPFVTLLKEIKKTAEEKRHVFATVAAVGTSGLSLKIDGESSGTAKYYTCNTDIHFSVGDRVIASRESGTYVIICKIGNPGGPSSKNDAMTQEVCVDTDGKLWTTPLPIASSTVLGGVKPDSKTSAMTQAVGVDSNGKLWTATASEQKISTIYAENATSNSITLNSSKVFSPSATGFALGSASIPFETMYIGGSSTYYWTITQASILPSKKTTLYFDIGSENYPINALYAQSIYINGTKITAGSDMSGTDVKMGGNDSNYILCNTSRELRPYSISTSYPCYLGTSSYYWHYAYIGANTVSIGSSSSSKLGFFGTTPVVRQTISKTSNNMSYSDATSTNYLYILNNLIGILKNKYGLIA